MFTETSVTDFVIVCIGAYNIYCEAAEILSFFSGIVYFFQVSLFREIKFIATVKSWVFYKVCQTHMEFYIEGDIFMPRTFHGSNHKTLRTYRNSNLIYCWISKIEYW